MARLSRLAIIIELLFIATCAMVASVLFPYLCQDLSLSSFYILRPMTHKLLAERNAERVAAAMEYLNTHKFPQLFEKVNVSQTKYCIVIVSVKRPLDTKYLTQVVAKLIPDILDTKDSYIFAVYNADGNRHTEALNLSKTVPVITHDGTLGPKTHDHYEKERRDYVAALRWCAAKQSDYNVVLQDDALPSDSLMPTLNFVLHHCIGDPGTSWAALQMFYPEKYQGWGDHPTFVIELIAAVAVLSLMLTLASSLILPGPLLITCRQSSPFRMEIRRLLYWRWLLSASLVLYLLLCFGRAHWEELRKINRLLTSVTYARGCCTPAMLYPRRHTQELIDYLDSVKCSSQLPVDIAIDEFMKERKLKKLRTIPNLFWHIGMVSSLPKSQKSVKEYGLLFPPHIT